MRTLRRAAVKVAPSALLASLRSEAGSGGLLIIAAVAAMLVVNGLPGGAQWYANLLHAQIGPLDVHHWINDALMAIFFLVVGLEIKREWVGGHLSTWRSRRLPFIAAAAGMAAPAIVYAAMTDDVPGLSRGWAIPAATDIAFALGLLALLGRRVPTALKLFLATVAIVDDMGAVAIIALVYTSGLDLLALGAGAAVLAGMMAMNRSGVRLMWPYLAGFVALWVALMLSGVHATVAGVLAALTVPVTGATDATGSTLQRMEHAVHPWSAYLIVPVFGFANAGVPLPADWGSLLAPLPLGIAAGLFVGKQAGVFGAVALAVRFGLASLPRGVTWAQLYGLSLLCGIGFTMSLFIGGLAFSGRALLVDEAKLGILAGSLLSAMAGMAVLRFAPRHPDHDRIESELLVGDGRLDDART